MFRFDAKLQTAFPPADSGPQKAIYEIQYTWSNSGSLVGANRGRLPKLSDLQMRKQMDWEQAELILRLLKIICLETRVPFNKITYESSLLHDLGIAGLDGWELMEKIKSEFGIEMEEEDYLPYFGDEAAYNPIRVIIEKIRGADVDIPRLKVSDLLNSIFLKKWSVNEIH